MYIIWKDGMASGAQKKAFDIMIGDDLYYDKLLFKYEILTLIAYHLSIDAKIESHKIREEIIQKLKAVFLNGITSLGEYEDIHSFVEGEVSKLSPLAGDSVRTLLSRNEQVHSDLRLFSIDNLLDLEALILKGIINTYDAVKSDTTVPGFTHYRMAMPMKWMSYLDMVLKFNLEFCYEIDYLIDYLMNNVFGYGSGFGSLSIFDKEKFSSFLGIKANNENPLLLSNLRGYDELRILQTLSNFMIFNSRIAQDLILWSDEHGFLNLPNEYTTGSSLMPNKNNPDFLEMFIGYASEIASSVSMVQQGLLGKGSWYHRDFQIFKWKAMEGLHITKQLASHFFDLLSKIEIKQNFSIPNSIFATHNAMDLVKKGIPWKKAYSIIGSKIYNGESLDIVEPHQYSSYNHVIAKKKLNEVEERIKNRNSNYNRLLSQDNSLD